MSEETEQKPPVEIVHTPVELHYVHSAGQSATRFLRALKQGRLLGQRCPVDGKVYFPTRGSCPEHGVPTEGDVVELPDRGTLVMFSIVRIPSENLSVDPPFAAIQVLLDGSDSLLMHVLGEADLDDVRMGMRVEAVWRPKQEWDTSMMNIKYWRPTGEPDAPLESYREHV